MTITYRPRDMSDVPADAEQRCRYSGSYSALDDRWIAVRCLHRAEPGNDHCLIHDERRGFIRRHHASFLRSARLCRRLGYRGQEAYVLECAAQMRRQL